MMYGRSIILKARVQLLARVHVLLLVFDLNENHRDTTAGFFFGSLTDGKFNRFESFEGFEDKGILSAP
jgi:hypothetical protein